MIIFLFFTALLGRPNSPRGCSKSPINFKTFFYKITTPLGGPGTSRKVLSLYGPFLSNKSLEMSPGEHMSKQKLNEGGNADPELLISLESFAKNIHLERVPSG